jgi:hypothetical protein
MVIKKVVPAIFAIVPDLTRSIIAIVPHVIPVILPVFAVSVPPGLTILSRAIQIVPALALILLEVI